MDRTNGQEIFASLFGIHAEAIVAYGLDEAELENRGFDDPDMTVRAVIRNGNAPDAPEETWVLRAVCQEDGRVWLTFNDGGVIYCVAPPAFMDARYENFVSRWFVSPLMVDVRTLVVEYDGASFTYEIGGSSAEPIVTHRGKELDLDRFRAFYTLAVSAASNSSEVLDAEANGSARMRVKFIYRDSEKQADVLELYDLDARSCLVAVNGVAEFAMRNGYERAVKAAVEVLDGGGALPQSW